MRDLQAKADAKILAAIEARYRNLDTQTQAFRAQQNAAVE